MAEKSSSIQVIDLWRGDVQPPARIMRSIQQGAPRQDIDAGSAILCGQGGRSAGEDGRPQITVMMKIEKDKLVASFQ